MNATHVLAVSVSGLTAALVTTALIFATLPWLKLHAIDQPNGRSSHATPVPRGGGVGVLVGAASGAVGAQLVTGTSFTMVFVAFGVCVLAITAVGLVDDVRSLSSRVRLAVQLGLAVVMSSALVSVFGTSVLTALGITIAIAAFVNAFNFMDGVNGISGLVSAAIASWLALCGWLWSADAGVVVASTAVAASSLAFLPWNMFRAVVFLGDSGSYGLGFSLSALAAWSWLSGVPLAVAGAPLVIYVADVLLALAVKTRQGLSWDAPHRLHVYQRLADAGWSHPRVAGIVAFSVVVAGLTGLLITHVAVVGALMLAFTVLAYLQLPRVAVRHAAHVA